MAQQRLHHFVQYYMFFELSPKILSYIISVSSIINNLKFDPLCICNVMDVYTRVA